PGKARWLKDDEREWLERRISGEHQQIAAQHGVGILRSFWDPKVMLLSLNYIGIVSASLGMLLFLPTIIKELGISNMQVGWVTMIPYGCGAVAMVFCGWLSDRIGERRWTLFWTCALSAGGLFVDVGGDLAVLAAHPARGRRRRGISASGRVSGNVAGRVCYPPGVTRKAGTRNIVAISFARSSSLSDSCRRNARIAAPVAVSFHSQSP